MTIPKQYNLISLDVLSLHTRIPLSIVDKIYKKKCNHIETHTQTPLEIFYKAVKLTLNSTYFKYKHIFY